MRRRPRARWIVVAILLVLGAFAASRWWLRRVDVVATPVVRGRAVDAIYATGTVEAERRVVVKAKVPGPVAELSVREGAPVRQNDTLARIDNPSATFDLRRSQVEASAASAQAGKDAPRLVATRARIEALDAQL